MSVDPGSDSLSRSSDDEKRAQLENLARFHSRWAEHSEIALAQLQEAARRGENLFDILLETVKVASLGQISESLFEVGGRYRRAM